MTISKILLTNACKVGVVVAHPDDEVLWMGGAMLMHPHWDCTIATLCRKSDPDRSLRFQRVMQALGASGRMADLDDGPEQRPLTDAIVDQAVEALTAGLEFDLLFTHGPRGEYTWHARHVEVSRAVCRLWAQGRLQAGHLLLFAYEDGQRAYFPRASSDAPLVLTLPAPVLDAKRRLVQEEYGFAPESWEARTTPATEAFYPFATPMALREWLHEKEKI